MACLNGMRGPSILIITKAGAVIAVAAQVQGVVSESSLTGGCAI